MLDHQHLPYSFCLTYSCFDSLSSIVSPFHPSLYYVHNFVTEHSTLKLCWTGYNKIGRAIALYLSLLLQLPYHHLAAVGHCAALLCQPQ